MEFQALYAGQRCNPLWTTAKISGLETACRDSVMFLAMKWNNRLWGLAIEIKTVDLIGDKYRQQKILN